MEEKEKKISELEAMERLARVMNDTPTKLKVGEKEYTITALKIGVQQLIAEESCRIQRNETESMNDIINQFARNIPSVVKCLALAILNDRDKIFEDYAARKYSKEFERLYNDIMYESDENTWLYVLVEIMQRLNLDFFFRSIEAMTTLRNMALKKRTTNEQS
jgi:hypothetical protein